MPKKISYYVLRITICFMLMNFQTAMSQVMVKGKVTNENNKPLEAVLVGISRDSVLLGNAVTDSAGNYRFENLERGVYDLRFGHIASGGTTLHIVIHTDTLIHMQFPVTQLLSEIVVEGKKPIMERQIDRFRFNVAGTDLVAGNNVWEVIEKTPLVQVSADGAIQVSGTTGAIVYVNNKRRMLVGDALKSYLSSIPSDNLEAIEVIQTPPSRYDAEGGAGIINIVMKKNEQEGLIGNTVLSTRQTAVNSAAASVYLNARRGNWNVYSDVYMGNRSRMPESQRDVHYPAGATLDLIERNITSSGRFRDLYPGANLGVDYEINPRHTVGLLFDYYGNWRNETRAAFSYDHYTVMDSLALTDNQFDVNNQTYSLNLNYQGDIDPKGKKLNVDLDALRYRSTNYSTSKTNALDLENSNMLFVRDWFRSSSPQNISNQSIKVDFEWPLNEDISMDFGAKASFSRIDNDLVFEDRISDDLWVRDLNRSNLFRYDEHINALYTTIDHELSAKWSYQLGVRLENTMANGWLDGEKAVDRNYFNVFPTAFVKYTTTKEKSYVLAVSSRITRPSFWDVNPFRTYTTDETYFEGNPFLLPSMYYRQELSHTLRGGSGTYTFQLAASQTLDEFYALPFNPTENVIANRKVNYGNRYGYSSAVVFFDQPRPWWRLSGSILAGYVVTDGLYSEDIVIDNRSFILSLSANQTFMLSKEKGFSCTVIASNAFPFTIVNTRIGNRLETEIRLRKSAGAFNITLSGQDFFKSNRDRYRIELNEWRIYDDYYYDTRSVALAVSFDFGRSTVKRKRDRDTGGQDVRQRLS